MMKTLSNEPVRGTFLSKYSKCENCPAIIAKFVYENEQMSTGRSNRTTKQQKKTIKANYNLTWKEELLWEGKFLLISRKFFDWQIFSCLASKVSTRNFRVLNFELKVLSTQHYRRREIVWNRFWLLRFCQKLCRRLATNRSFGISWPAFVNFRFESSQFNHSKLDVLTSSELERLISVSWWMCFLQWSFSNFFLAHWWG